MSTDGSIDEVRNLEDVLVNGLQALQESIAALRIPQITSISQSNSTLLAERQ